MKYKNHSSELSIILKAIKEYHINDKSQKEMCEKYNIPMSTFRYYNGPNGNMINQKLQKGGNFDSEVFVKKQSEKNKSESQINKTKNQTKKQQLEKNKTESQHISANAETNIDDYGENDMVKDLIKTQNVNDYIAELKNKDLNRNTKK